MRFDRENGRSRPGEESRGGVPSADQPGRSINRNRSVAEVRSAADGIEKHRAQMELECASVNFSNILFVVDKIGRDYDLQTGLERVAEYARDGLTHALEVLYGPRPEGGSQ